MTIRAKRKLPAVLLVLAALGNCVPAGTPSTPGTPPAPEATAPESAAPTVRVALAVGAGAATIGGAGALTVTTSDGSMIAQVPAGEVWRLVPAGAGIAVASPGGWTSSTADVLAIAAAGPDAPVRINGRTYHGTGEVLRDRTGITVVNRVGMEDYLLGVVSAEMGRRSPDEQEALRAQAVVSRTYALRNLGRWRAQGFDLHATVADQVYGGMDLETPEGIEAVRATRGLVLTYGGAPIDAFFYSTCGGRTEEGIEVFRAAARPYLRSVSDLGADGQAYCRTSPRFQWREEWSGDLLQATLRRTLPAVLGIPSAQVRDVRDVRVAARTGSGRVGQLAIGLGGSEVHVEGRSVRQVLRAPSGELLRSNAFTLRVTSAGRRITRVVAEGGGAGHGVGFCQWGAVGRSRAGHRYDQILAAYFQGTTLQRLY